MSAHASQTMKFHAILSYVRAKAAVRFPTAVPVSQQYELLILIHVVRNMFAVSRFIFIVSS